MKRNVKIETPGAAVIDPPSDDAPVADVAKTPAPPQAANAEMTPAQERSLHQQLAQTAKLVGSHAALDWSGLTANLPAAQGAKRNPEDDLPDFIDAATITAPVLTKTGWVIPVNDPRARFGGR